MEWSKPQPWKTAEQIWRSGTLSQSYSQFSQTPGNPILYFLRLTMILHILKPIHGMIRCCCFQDLEPLIFEGSTLIKEKFWRIEAVSFVQEKLEFILEIVLSVKGTVLNFSAQWVLQRNCFRLSGNCGSPVIYSCPCRLYHTRPQLLSKWGSRASFVLFLYKIFKS